MSESILKPKAYSAGAHRIAYGKLLKAYNDPELALRLLSQSSHESIEKIQQALEAKETVFQKVEKAVRDSERSSAVTLEIPESKSTSQSQKSAQRKRDADAIRPVQAKPKPKLKKSESSKSPAQLKTPTRSKAKKPVTANVVQSKPSKAPKSSKSVTKSKPSTPRTIPLRKKEKPKLKEKREQKEAKVVTPPRKKSSTSPVLPKQPAAAPIKEPLAVQEKNQATSKKSEPRIYIAHDPFWRSQTFRIIAVAILVLLLLPLSWWIYDGSQENASPVDLAEKKVDGEKQGQMVKKPSPESSSPDSQKHPEAKAITEPVKPIIKQPQPILENKQPPPPTFVATLKMGKRYRTLQDLPLKPLPASSYSSRRAPSPIRLLGGGFVQAVSLYEHKGEEGYLVDAFSSRNQKVGQWRLSEIEVHKGKLILVSDQEPASNTVRVKSVQTTEPASPAPKALVPATSMVLAQYKMADGKSLQTLLQAFSKKARNRGWTVWSGKPAMGKPAPGTQQFKFNWTVSWKRNPSAKWERLTGQWLADGRTNQVRPLNPDAQRFLKLNASVDLPPASNN